MVTSIASNPCCLKQETYWKYMGHRRRKEPTRHGKSYHVNRLTHLAGGNWSERRTSSVMSSTTHTMKRCWSQKLYVSPWFAVFSFPFSVLTFFLIIGTDSVYGWFNATGNQQLDVPVLYLVCSTLTSCRVSVLSWELKVPDKRTQLMYRHAIYQFLFWHIVMGMWDTVLNFSIVCRLDSHSQALSLQHKTCYFAPDLLYIMSIHLAWWITFTGALKGGWSTCLPSSISFTLHHRGHTLTTAFIPL